MRYPVISLRNNPLQILSCKSEAYCMPSISTIAHRCSHASLCSTYSSWVPRSNYELETSPPSSSVHNAFQCASHEGTWQIYAKTDSARKIANPVPVKSFSERFARLCLYGNHLECPIICVYKSTRTYIVQYLRFAWVRSLKSFIQCIGMGIGSW